MWVCSRADDCGNETCGHARRHLFVWVWCRSGLCEWLRLYAGETGRGRRVECVEVGDGEIGQRVDDA